MPIYMNSSDQHPDQGMIPNDMRAIERVAARRNEIIMFRSTGPWSRPHIAAGHPTKPFHVKGKSSTWGPHAGFVPEDSQYSKAVSATDIAKGKKLNQEAIHEKFARPVQLFLSDAYIQQYLRENRGMTSRPAVDQISEPRDGVRYFFCTKPNNDDGLEGGKKYVFLGQRTSQGDWQIFAFPDEAVAAKPNQMRFLEEKAKPMMVLAVPGSNLPITGDYDLFAVCPSWAHYGSKDKKMDPTLDDPKQNASMKRTLAKAQMFPTSVDEFVQMTRAKVSLAKIERAKTPEDPDRGNITPRIFEVIVALNAEMGAAYGGGMKIGKPNVYKTVGKSQIVNQRVHHNAESGRPFAPGVEDGFPLTIFHPDRPVGEYTFRNATIVDRGDLVDYFKKIFAAGYYVPRNPAWTMPVLNPEQIANFGWLKLNR